MSGPAQLARTTLVRGYFQLFPDDVAAILEDAPAADAADLLSTQSAPRAAEVLRRLSPEAQSSSIILTTVTDVAGFFVFLGLAQVFSAML